MTDLPDPWNVPPLSQAKDAATCWKCPHCRKSYLPRTKVMFIPGIRKGHACLECVAKHTQPNTGRPVSKSKAVDNGDEYEIDQDDFS